MADAHARCISPGCEKDGLSRLSRQSRPVVSNQAASSGPLFSPFLHPLRVSLCSQEALSIQYSSAPPLAAKKPRTERALMVSSVAQGKRPATSATTAASTPSRKTSASHPPASAATTKPTPTRTDNQATRQPQKRVLPSRSRRGGPGLGSADVDAIIMDAQKRKCEPLFVKTICTQIRPVVPFRVEAEWCDHHRPARYTRFLCGVASAVFSHLPH